MKYTVSIANNLRILQPELAKEMTICSDTALTISEIAAKAGIYSLLLVGGIVDQAVYPLDQPIKMDTKIVLIGPVAGG